MARHVSGVVELDRLYQWMAREAKHQAAIKYRCNADGNSAGVYEACGYREALQDLAKLLGLEWQEIEG